MLFGKSKGEDPLALLQQGKFKEAARILEAKLKNSPDDYSVKMRLAEAYEGDGRRDQAAGIYREEGEANLAGGDRSQGLALLKRALRLVPGEESLAARIAKLEGQPEVSSDQAFSFDVEVAAVSSETGNQPSPEPIPMAVAGPAPEPRLAEPPCRHRPRAGRRPRCLFLQRRPKTSVRAICSRGFSRSWTRHTWTCLPRRPAPGLYRRETSW